MIRPLLVCDECEVRWHARCGPSPGTDGRKGSASAGEARLCLECLESQPLEAEEGSMLPPSGTPVLATTGSAASIGSELSASNKRQKKKKKLNIAHTDLNLESSALMDGLPYQCVDDPLEEAFSESFSDSIYGPTHKEESGIDEIEDSVNYFQGDQREQLMTVNSICAMLGTQLPSPGLSAKDAQIINAFRSWASVKELNKVLCFLKAIRKQHFGEYTAVTVDALKPSSEAPPIDGDELVLLDNCDDIKVVYQETVIAEGGVFDADSNCDIEAAVEEENMEL